MINILELVYGGGLAPDSNPIHIFDPDRDMYEHAEFSLPNGDFYQIVKVSPTLTLYHFQKEEADIISDRFIGDWWLRHEPFTKRYENRQSDIFYTKVSDRMLHDYRVDKLVIAQGKSMNIRQSHPDYEKVMQVYGRK